MQVYLRLSILFLLETTAAFTVDLFYEPWFTGPYFNYTAEKLEKGALYFEPSIIVFHTYGQYDQQGKLLSTPDMFSINPILDIQMGITDRLGIEITTSLISNHRSKIQSTQMEDSTLILGYQLIEEQSHRWAPNFRLDFIQIFPTGSYNRLNPDKNGTDSTGQGSFKSGFVLITEKTFQLQKNVLNTELSFTYLFSSDVSVQGFNAYGGTYSTRGIVNTGNVYNVIFSLEYSLTQKWGIILESLFEHQMKSTFYGKTGLISEETPAKVGLPSSTSWSIAPEIEYNFSPNFGLISGLWVSLGGKNSHAFYAGFLAIASVF